ncbi:MAG: hypothetical protein J6A94_00300 [Lachnospiraceae bacterium]|nr:hypothetical protein [Lachnospiraceae bacterium]
MIKHRDWRKILVILPVLFFRKCDLLMSGGIPNEMPVAEYFLQNIFSGNPSRQDTNVIIVLFGLFEVIVFNLLFGTHIYHDLYENSVYIFVRVKSRTTWFVERARELFWYSGIYNALFLGITFCLCVFHTEKKIDGIAVRLLVITYILIQLFAFFTTLLINITAIYMGAFKAFMVNYIVLAMFSLWAVEFESVPILNQFPILLKLNPVANITLQWNDGIGEGLLPVLYFVVLIGIALWLGNRMICGMDISINSREYE